MSASAVRAGSQDTDLSCHMAICNYLLLCVITIHQRHIQTNGRHARSITATCIATIKVSAVRLYSTEGCCRVKVRSHRIRCVASRHRRASPRLNRMRCRCGNVRRRAVYYVAAGVKERYRRALAQTVVLLGVSFP